MADGGAAARGGEELPRSAPLRCHLAPTPRHRLSPPPPSHTDFFSQGAGQVGNAPLEPGVDTRHTPGRGYDPATGEALPVPDTRLDALGYDPATGTVAVDVTGPAGAYGALGGYKDAISDAVTPAAAELAHAAAAAAAVAREGEEEGDEDEEKK